MIVPGTLLYFFSLFSFALAVNTDPQIVVTRTNTGRTVCAVRALGGGQDDGPAINTVFTQAYCGSNGLVVLDGYYVVDTLLMTTGLENVDIELSGTVQYTPDIAKWSPQSYYLTFQNATTFWFLSGTDVHLYGGGTLDGNGQVWWDEFAANGNAGTAGGSSRTFARPVPLTVGNSSNVLVEDLTEIGSPFWNNFVYQSTNVTYRGVNISSLSYNPSAPAVNSDGWDIYRSSYVTITNSTINNDDDCVSFKPNSTNILVSDLNCNGSHGISVGSLGQYAAETDIVANISAYNIIMKNAENGARIKVFGGSPDPNSTAGGGTGYVKNVTFTNFYVENVDYPIYINQCYSTNASVCAEYPSTLSISDIHYINVTGSSSNNEGAIVGELECSAECYDITATGTNLTTKNGTEGTFVCQNVNSTSELDFQCTAPTAGTS